MPHVAGKPFVLALQNFSAEDSLHVSDVGLVHYLYGFQSGLEADAHGRAVPTAVDVDTIVGERKPIPSGFFSLAGTEHVSAVMWTNSGTVMKFARMGFQQGIDSGGIRRMAREGFRHVAGDQTFTPAWFAYEVGSRWERWEEGIAMAHNPNTMLPLPEDCFPGIVHHSIGPDGEYRGLFPDFLAYNSGTLIELRDPPDAEEDGTG